MEEYNWKKELKKFFKQMLDMLFFQACMVFVCWIVYQYQDAKQLEAISYLIDSRDWSVFLILSSGVWLWAALVNWLAIGILKLIMVAYKLFIKKC